MGKHLGARKMVTADKDKENADEEECNVHVSFPQCQLHIDSLLASEPKLEAACRTRMILRANLINQLLRPL